MKYAADFREIARRALSGRWGIAAFYREVSGTERIVTAAEME